MNNNEENRAPKLVQLSVKVNQQTLDRWKENLTTGMYNTAGQFFETLINQYEENYTHPVRVNEHNEKTIKELEQKVKDLSVELEALTAKAGNTERLLESVSEEKERLTNELQQANSSLKISELADKDVIRVPVEKIDRMCLQYLADRENRNRHRSDITPEIFFMYAVKELLIKGNKFSIACVPDSVISQFKKQISDEEE